MLWALFTCLAAAAQTLRNALQRDLVARVGVVGATNVRFLFGFPFAVGFLMLMHGITGEAVPGLSLGIIPMVALAALSQIGATGLMLAAMKTRSFVITIAYTKTEPVLVALFGLLFLGDHLTAPMLVAVLIATSGVLLTAWPKAGAERDAGEGSRWPALVQGVGAAALFALSAVAFREAIRALPEGGVGIRASTVLVLGLFMQAMGLSLFLAMTDRPALVLILKNWRPSLLAGFMGALASQFWFLGFALTSAARVRTLALVEVFFARMISGRMFSEKPDAREALGLGLIVLGVGLLLNQS